MQDSPTLIAAEERLSQAERNFARNRDDLFPELSLSARTSRTRTGGNEQAEFTNDSTSIGLSASYTVDLFGAQAARYRAQVAGFIGTKYDTDLARITLAQNVARAYFNLLGVRSRVEVASENLRIAEQILRIVDARYRNGVVREFDLSQQNTSVLQQPDPQHDAALVSLSCKAISLYFCFTSSFTSSSVFLRTQPPSSQRISTLP